MNKRVKAIALSAIMIFGAQHLEAQKLKDKIGKIKNVKSKGGSKFDHLNSIEDEMGINGSYTSFEPEEFKKPGAYTTKKISNFGFEFQKEKDGDVVNNCLFRYGKTDKDLVALKLKENWKSKYNQIIFYKWISASKYMEMIVLEPGVIVATSVNGTITNNGGVAPADWERSVDNVFAKNPEKLLNYDKETAKAKVDIIMQTLNVEALAKKKKEMEGYKAYKEYVGRMAFSSKLGTFNYRYKDKPTEDPKNFKKELVLGEQLYFRGYLDKPLAVSYPGAWYNISYELMGVKVDRENLRSKNSFFSKNIKRKDSWKDAYCTWVKSLIEKQRGFDVWDYAFIELLYQNKEKFEIGKSYELKVTITAYKDGEDVGEVCAGAVNLKYTEKSKELLHNNDPNNLGIIDKYESYLEE